MGALASLRLAVAGWQVLCLRLPDDQRPFADTLRNQGWLQSGIRYFAAAAQNTLMAKEARERIERLAFDMAESGVELVRFAGGPRVAAGAEGPGLIGATEPDAQELLKLCGDLWPYPPGLKTLSSDEASRLAGPFHDPALTWLSSPEKVFDEDALLTEIRQKAESNGAILREVSEPVRVNWKPGSSGTTAVAYVGAQMIEPQRLVLAAGAQNVTHLASLGEADGFQIQLTPLLVLEPETPMEARILTMRGTPRYSVAQHVQQDRTFLVVGGNFNGGSPSRSVTLPPRRVPAGSCEAIRQALPPGLGLRTARMTAGFELLPPNDWPDFAPYVRGVREGANVVVAHPGRATFAWKASTTLLELDGDSSDFGEEDDRGPRPRPLTEGATKSFYGRTLPGTEWNNSSSIRMHFHPYYEARGMNDELAD